MGDKLKAFFNFAIYAAIAIISCIFIVTRLSYLGIFLISALYLAIHIYTFNQEKGRDKVTCVLYTGLYVVLILISLYQYSVTTEEINRNEYLSGQRYGYEEGYVEGRRDAVNAADDITNDSYRVGYNDGFNDGYVEAENYYLYEFYS